MKILIVTGANEQFSDLTRGLVHSLVATGIFEKASLGFLDLGMSEESLAWLKNYKATIVTPGWDLPVHPKWQAESPHVRALTARPFLPQYFPGYDIYMWIDADTWVQQGRVLEWYIRAAAEGALAITPQIDRAYRIDPDIMKWRYSRLVAYYGKEKASVFYFSSYYNAGVFALRADAPHWKIWEDCFREGLNATKGGTICDQTALNHAMWSSKLPVHPLPAICNWTCHLAIPSYDMQSGFLCEPNLPYEPIGIIHLTSGTKNHEVEYTDRQGVSGKRTLQYLHE